MKVELFGLYVDNLTMDETIQAIEGFIADGGSHQHVVVNVNKVIKAAYDPVLKLSINTSSLVNVDGMPVVWASHLLGKVLKERVAGVDIFERLLARANEKKWRVYFLGAEDVVLTQVLNRAKRDYPNLIIAGAHNGYWQTDEEHAIIHGIKESQAQILFVALPTPQKELLLETHLDAMQVPFAMGVGGSFDVYAGKVKRAPRWMQNYCLEWFYRFIQEPRKFFKRYFIEGLTFVTLLMKEMLKQKTR